ncbi:MAG TPA: endo-1,4-beta-xylanase [Clostridiales bacterium]|nr:endo-1,4-beta-xylanase [Clostridiales bacterium]
MKSKIFSITSLIMILILAITITGCSNTDDPDKESSQSSESSDEIDQTKEETEEASLEEETETKEVVEGSQAIIDNLSTEGGIKDVYEQVDLLAGTCLSETMINNEGYENLIKENFTSITLENDMKPEAILNKAASIEAGDLVVKFPEKTIDLLDWAKENDMSARGHVLVWYSQTPDWIFYEDFDESGDLVDRDTLLNRMDSYIKQVFDLLDELGYSDMFHGYDVVNEAILDDGSLRDCYWKEIIGDDYIWHAFNYTDKYAPEHIKLYYNDFNEQFKTQAIIDLANDLVDEDGESLIDGIGCQGHLYTRDSIDQYVLMLKSFSSLGLDVQITELDISLGTWENVLEATEENLVDQGKYYYEFVSKIVRENLDGNTNVSGITFWGFDDGLSWRHDRSPLLYNGVSNPKYSYYGAKLDKDNAGY